MAHPTIGKLRLNYALDSAWTPADFNRFSLQAREFVDFMVGPHDTSLEHLRDELIPKEMVIATYAAGVYTPQVYTDGISAVTTAATGQVTVEFDPDFTTGIEPMVIAFPKVVSTEQVFAYVDGGRTNDETAVSFNMWENVLGAFVDRDFLALIFAPRR